MKTSRLPLIVFVLVALIMTCASVDAFGQKKKPASPPPPAAEQQRPQMTPPPSPKSGALLKDMLGHFKGQMTSIGRLKAVEADYILVDDDGSEIAYPMAAIRSIKVVKQDEENPDENAPKLEIKLQ